MSYVFRRAKSFRNAFEKLSGPQRKAAYEAFKIFKQNPFDSRLKPHKINRLSSLWRQTVHSVTVDSDLRVTFIQVNNEIWSLDIGGHEIYG